MSFRDFTLAKARTDFRLHSRMNRRFFPDVAPVPISDDLAGFWARRLGVGLTLLTEKGRSELVIAPLLFEVWLCSDKQVNVLSGVEWTVDSAAGLNGVSDFILCRGESPIELTAPVLVAAQAKRDSLAEGYGQCAATLVAAQRFNAGARTPVEPLYGCVTTASLWRFLRLSGTELDIDEDEYSVHQADRLFGVLLHCCGVRVGGG